MPTAEAAAGNDGGTTDGTTEGRALRQLVVIAELGSGGAESVVVQLATRARARGEGVVVASAGGWREQALADVGVELVSVPLRRAALRDTLTSVRDLRRRLGSAPVDVVHAHNVRAALVARLAAVGRRPRPPLLVSVHGLPARRYRLAARVLGAAADLVVAVSCDVADRLVAGGLPAARVRVVDNAPDHPAELDRDTARTDLGLSRTGPVVLCLARLAPPKRPDLVVRAIAQVPGVRLLVAGDGVLRAEVEGLVRELDLGGRVEVLGDRRDVARLLAAADLVVLSSDSEGLPITVLEAMAAGVPVVASRVGGLIDLDPDAVRLVEPDDVDALGAAVSELLSDPALALAQAVRARELVAQRFSTSAMDRGYRAVVRELVGRPAPPADASSI
ncbi:glycosyltransferase [Nocardioides plantarum]|uniref:glycosyltransferase n=1 Tax=Nocardioides plantarum TaxID=29299 RepID=UPI001B869B40|nr:glycosyltransferase [Nocardioides plantarum]